MLCSQVRDLLSDYSVDLLDARRLRAVDALEAYGAPAQPYLVRALQDPSLQVQCQAAGALARTGDRRAIGPLIRTLRRKPLVYSVQMILGGLVGVGVGASFAMLGETAYPIAILCAIGQCWSASGIVKSLHRNQMSSLCCEIARALDTIAARDPRSDLLKAIQELERMESEYKEQAEVRALSRDVAERLRSAVEAIHNLPVPAEPPTQIIDNLPIVATLIGQAPE